MFNYSVISMTSLLKCLLLFNITLFSSYALANDSSPQPTTSPTNSKQILIKRDVGEFINARAAIMRATKEYQTLAVQSKKGASRVQKAKMNSLLKQIEKQTNTVRSYSVKMNGAGGKNIADRLIINDDVTGKQSSIQSTAKLLGLLSSKLALLEPVVHR